MTDLTGELTLEEKASLAAGVDLWHTFAVERLGIPVIKMTDGPVGARGAEYLGGPPSTCFPCGTALASTWDVDLVQRVGAALGEEARAKGAHVLLAPTVNIHRTPLAGRNFECFSEDPHLTAAVAAAYVGGVQSVGVAACIKHFVCNDSEFERHTISSEVGERPFREIYLAPFERVLHDVHPWALMGAYNKLAGTWCCEHPGLLTDILRKEWGWDGVVVSDWWATHTTADAANAGLDVEMPGPPQFMGGALADAVRHGQVDEAVLDEKVGRLLLLAERTRAAERPPGEERSGDDPGRRALAREAAVAGIVLLQNEGGLLPLAAPDLRTVAVIGPNADVARILGGGSAAVTPPYLITPLEALTGRLPDAAIRHEPGCTVATDTPSLDLRLVGGGLDLAYVAGLDPDGEAVATTRVAQARVVWRDAPAPGLDVGGWSARLTGELRPRRAGVHTFKLRNRGRVRLWLDDDLVVDGWDTARTASPTGRADLDPARTYRLRIDLVPPPGPIGALEIRGAEPVPDDQLERAVAAAAEADVAVVVVGLDSELESEGHDRADMSLPGGQAELVEQVARANPRTVVVVNAGSPVDMAWAPQVPAILQLWYPGQEGANALADVLLGEVSPSGRLPTTFPRRLEDVPAMAHYPGAEGRVVYGEGLDVGYRGFDRRGIEPRFPFGHGLTYTTFEYGEVRVEGRTVEVDVTNTGPVAGAEVVQLYVHDVDASVERPPRELRGFVRLALEPGETATASFLLDDRAFAFWDERTGGWVVEPGGFELQVGSSSRDIRGRVTIEV